jgi:hypothetical protein
LNFEPGTLNLEPQTILIETHYLPSIAYFVSIFSSSEIILERHEHYVKQTYRNRCHINTSQGVESMIIPVTTKQSKSVITEVRIDHDQKWLNNHWRTIQSAYGKSAFYEHYADDLEKALFKKFAFLYDLNCELLSMCLKWLKWNRPVRESLSYEKSPAPPVQDLRSLINPKEPNLLQKFYKPVAYSQVFGSAFAENMSLIDLIFCEGPGAARIVQASAIKK